MPCQCGNGCNNYTTPTSFSNVDISGSSIVGSSFSGGSISGAAIYGTTVNTIAELKALVVASLGDPSVIVLGYAAAGDGGGGIFRYDSGSAETVNTGTVFAPNVGAGRWLRLYSGAVNVKWFGAKGDGLTNDRAAIQAAIDAVAEADLSVGSGEVYFPSSVYVVGSTLLIDTMGITLRGDGDSSELRWTGGGSALVSVGIGGARHQILDLSFRSTNATVGTAVKVANGIGYASSVERCYFYGFQTQIEVGSGVGTVGAYRVLGCRMDLGADMVGVKFVAVQEGVIASSSIQGSFTASTGIILDLCVGTSIRDCVVEHNTNGEILITNGSRQTSISDCYIEVDGTNTLGIDIAATAKGTTVSGCWIAGSNFLGFPNYLIQIADGSDTTSIVGCSLVDPGLFAVRNLSTANGYITLVGNQTNGTLLTGSGSVELFSGKGGTLLRFPVTQKQSSDTNTLDDYEEGTWTPVLSGNTSAGVGTYTTQVGEYTKVGRLVQFNLRVAWTAHTGTGVMKFSLPFSNDSSLDVPVSAFVGTAPAFTGQLFSYVRASGDNARIADLSAAPGTSDLSITATGSVNIAGVYFAAT